MSKVIKVMQLNGKVVTFIGWGHEKEGVGQLL